MRRGKVGEELNLVNRDFQEARWNEPLIMLQGAPGRRGLTWPRLEGELRESLERALGSIPPSLRRSAPPRLPEVDQPHVVRHYSRLSQMVLGNNVANNLGLATATMKYSPPLHEWLIREPHMADLHPLQEEESVQGILEILYRCSEFLSLLSGLDRFSLQPGGGAAAIFTNALIVRAYFREKGEERDEVITTIHSHPANAAAAATAGFKVITLYPGPKGYPEREALEAALSERTAALFTTNPEDIGLFNPEIKDWVERVHQAGGLCVYDQANANGVVGMVRARECGFDLCHFNLHKTFSIPHGSYGGGCGAVGVRRELARFLPVPTVEFREGRYCLDYDRPDSVGVIRAFLGNAQAVVKAYAWMLSHGWEGLRTVAQISVLNNNYLLQEVLRVPGASVSYYPENREPRLEQVRCSWEKLAEETGIGTEEIRNRIVDFGLQTYWTSHHPYTIPEPFSLEPTESVSKEDLDEFAQVLHWIAREAYSQPELIRRAPHRSTTGPVRPDSFHNPPITWRVYERRRREGRP